MSCVVFKYIIELCRNDQREEYLKTKVVLSPNLQTFKEPVIDSKESIPPAWRAVTSNGGYSRTGPQAGNRFLGSLKGLEINRQKNNKEKRITEKLKDDISRARISKLLRSPRIDSKESMTPGCVAWRVGTTTLFLLGS